jgi:hypothetical protein
LSAPLAALSVHNRNPQPARSWGALSAPLAAARFAELGQAMQPYNRRPPLGSWPPLAAARRWPQELAARFATLAARFAALIMLAARRWGATAASSCPSSCPSSAEQPQELAASSAKQPPAAGELAARAGRQLRGATARRWPRPDMPQAPAMPRRAPMPPRPVIRVIPGMPILPIIPILGIMPDGRL